MLDTAHPRPFDPNPATAECQRTCYRTAHPSPIRAAAMESDYPGAAASLREGLDETLTVMRLDLPESLVRVLSSTNLIENLFSRVRGLATGQALARRHHDPALDRGGRTRSRASLPQSAPEVGRQVTRA